MGLIEGKTTGLTRIGSSYRVYVGKDYPQPVKLPEVKKWVSDWTEEFGFPPREVFINSVSINQRTIDRLHELGVMKVQSMGGVLAWEIHIGPMPEPTHSRNQNQH